MKRVVFLVSTFLLLSLPAFASAEVVAISGAIEADTTWTSSNIYVIDSNFSVLAGATLTIEPGTIIKAKTSAMSMPTIYGRLVAQGTSAAPIHFACFWDDSVGGDTDGYPDTECQNQWQGLYFKQGSTGVFEYVNLSGAGYGGYGYGNYVGIENDGGEVVITNSNIFNNFRYVGVWGFSPQKTGSSVINKNGGKLRIENSVIDNSFFGVQDDSGAMTEILNSTIKNNADTFGYGSGYGVFAYGPGSLILKNNIFVGNARTATIDGAKELVTEGNTSEDFSMRGFLISGFVRDGGVLASADLPLIISGGISNTEGGSFSISAGTIIKALNNSGITVRNGEIKILGTKESPVIFTSIADDSVGGDTNNDGDATTPGWPNGTSGIQIDSGAKAAIDYAKIKYTGGLQDLGAMTSRSAILNYQGELEIKNSEIIDGGMGVFGKNASTTITKTLFDRTSIPLHLDGGQMTVRESSFKGNFQVQNYGETTLDAKNNWWSSPAGPYHEVLNPTGNTSASVQDRIDFIPWLTEEPGSTSEHSLNPIIIIPGIMGSAKKNGELLIDPILHTYDDLIATLEANGYQKEKNIFTFPYEWRDSNVVTANLLKDKISAVKTACENAKTNNEISADLGQTDCDKVDLVAHSMGGLVAREYIQSGQYQQDVDQLIFLGTPHKGSPTAYLQWEGGEFPPDVLQQIAQLIFSIKALKNFYPSTFDYIHDRPISSVQELLPIFDYIKDKETGILRTYPVGYPRNIFLEALNTDTNIYKLLNSGVRIKNIVGNVGDASTIEKIRVGAGSNPLWIHGKPDGIDGSTADHGLENGNGDTTVTAYGSTLNPFIRDEIIDGSHRSLPGLAQGKVTEFLMATTSIVQIHTNMIQKLLSIQLKSPIDMLITAPDGKRMGKNFETGGEYNEIPGAFYSGFGTDEEYITIPNPLDGEYKIELQGTDDGGEFGVVTSYIGDESVTTKEYTDTIKPDEIKETTAVISDQNNILSLEIKAKENEETEEIIPPTIPPPTSGSSSGSSRRTSGEVLGVSTIEDTRALQLKLIDYLNQLIQLYMLLLKNN